MKSKASLKWREEALVLVLVRSEMNFNVDKIVHTKVSSSTYRDRVSHYPTPRKLAPISVGITSSYVLVLVIKNVFLLERQY